MEVIIISIILISVIVNAITAYFLHKSHKAKSELLNNRIESISELYLPVLEVMRSYYADRENYLLAKRCKDLIKSITDTDNELKKQ